MGLANKNRPIQLGTITGSLLFAATESETDDIDKGVNPPLFIRTSSSEQLNKNDASIANTNILLIVSNHSLAGASMLENIPEFSHIMKIILCHHENWDGTGYPKRLKGVNIPLGARIIAVANHYDRIINPCTEHWQKSHADATRELQDRAGLSFDPDVVHAFLKSVISAKK